jgi:hypothetical protein
MSVPGTPKRPRNLTPSLCTHVQTQMLAACREVAEAHGLVVEDGGIQEMDLRHAFSFNLRVGIPDADGALFEPGKALFGAMAETYGLSPDDLGRTFTVRGETFRITGLSPNRPKYPIDVERLPDRRGFKFPADIVALHLKATGA